jgi:hypothetical protein
MQNLNILYEMIRSYEFHEWILSYHNILDFLSITKLHHSLYYMIMDSTYLLKCLVEDFFWHRKQCDAIDKNEDNFERFWWV